ncbi:hypothetical protein N7488_010877 [Penicillium malachiteum]|nr:hypothetical protein N7488_010877 [Penicillium malachiteum]
MLISDGFMRPDLLADITSLTTPHTTHRARFHPNQRVSQNTAIAPQFAGHIHEHFHSIGFRVEERDANTKDLKSSQAALQRLYNASRYKVIIQGNKVQGMDRSNEMTTWAA